MSPGPLKKIVAQYVEHSRHGDNTYDRLSERECQILILLAEGGSVKEIAAKLKLSVKTIDARKYT